MSIPQSYMCVHNISLEGQFRVQIIGSYFNYIVVWGKIMLANMSHVGSVEIGNYP